MSLEWKSNVWMDIVRLKIKTMSTAKDAIEDADAILEAFDRRTDQWAAEDGIGLVGAHQGGDCPAS